MILNFTLFNLKTNYILSYQVEWTVLPVHSHDLVKIYTNGTLVFHPFAVEKYRHEIHASVYRYVEEHKNYNANFSTSYGCHQQSCQCQRRTFATFHLIKFNHFHAVEFFMFLCASLRLFPLFSPYPSVSFSPDFILRHSTKAYHF